MDVFISLIISIFEEGFIYGIMAIGVYITYKVLDFPDLTVDGSFPLGMCFTGLLISVGVDPWIACVLSFLAGAVAGGITGILHGINTCRISPYRRIGIPVASLQVLLRIKILHRRERE